MRMIIRRCCRIAALPIIVLLVFDCAHKSLCQNLFDVVSVFRTLAQPMFDFLCTFDSNLWRILFLNVAYNAISCLQSVHPLRNARAHSKEHHFRA